MRSFLLTGLFVLTQAVPGAAHAIVRQDTIQAGDRSVDVSKISLGRERRVWHQLRGGALLRRGGYEVETSRGTWSGQRALVYRLATMGGELVDSAWGRFDNLAPIAHRSHAAPRTMALDFDGARTTGSVSWAGGDVDRVDDRATHRPFDSSLLNFVIAGLPLADGYRAVIPAYIREQGGLVWHRIATTGPRLVARADGLPVEAWRVEVTSDRGSTVVHYIDRETGRTLRTDIGSSLVVLPEPEAPNARAAALARDWVRGAIEAMGGERLGAVGTMRIEQIGYDNALEQSERPEGPWVKIFQEINEVRDGRAGRIRRTMRQRSGPWSPTWSSELTYVADEHAAIVMRGERSGPTTPAQQRNLLAAVRLAPERILFTALDAADLVAIGDTVAGGTRNLRVQFSLDGRRIQILIDAHTMVPHGWVAYGPSSRGFDQMWGDVTLGTTWYVWSLHDNGVLYPGAARVDLNGQTLSDFTFTSVAFDVPGGDDSLAIAPDLARAYAEQATPTPGAVQFGASFQGELLDPIEAAPGITVFPGTWNVAAVVQGDSVVVLELPISSEYSVQAIAAVESRTGRPVKAAITTSDAWPHFAGTREYVARGVPVYHLDLNGPILERFLAAQYTREPDSLQRAPAAADFHAVGTRTQIGTGRNRIELFPVRGEGGERMMMVYFPAHRLLYGSDLIQKLPDGTFWAPEYLAEVAAVVAREGLEVETVFAMHTTPIPWSEVVAALP